jgi:uncharacterized membrane protein YeaQ/YmgE (transglycosylase-associated protein family)
MLLVNRKEVEKCSILAWVVLGLIAGFIGSKIVNKSGEGVILDVLLGIVGAAGVTGLNLYSLLVAVIGSVVFLVVYHTSVRFDLGRKTAAPFVTNY